MGPEALAIEGAYKAGGITLAVCVALLIGIVLLFRLWRNSEREHATMREGALQQAQSDVAVLQREKSALQEARLADQRQASNVLLGELQKQRDALESSSSAGRDQAEALDAFAKSIGEIRADVREQNKEIAAMRAGKRGPV